MTETLPQTSDIRTTPERRAPHHARANDGTRRLGPSPEEIRAICTEYELALAEANASFGCQSDEQVTEASDRYLRAQVAIEALGYCLPVTRRQMAPLQAAEDAFVTETAGLTRGDIELLSAATLRLANVRERAHRAVHRAVHRADAALTRANAALTRRVGARRPECRQRSAPQARSGGSTPTTRGGDSGDEPPGEPPGRPATLAEIEALIRRLVPDLVRRELDAHARRPASTATEDIAKRVTAIADDVAELVAKDAAEAHRRARAQKGGR